MTALCACGRCVPPTRPQVTRFNCCNKAATHGAGSVTTAQQAVTIVVNPGRVYEAQDTSNYAPIYGNEQITYIFNILYTLFQKLAFFCLHSIREIHNLPAQHVRLPDLVPDQYCTVFQSLFYLFVHSFIDYPWLAQAACWSDFPWLKKIFHPRASSPLPRPRPHPPLIMVSRLSGVLAARGPAGPQPVSQQEENEV